MIFGIILFILLFIIAKKKSIDPCHYWDMIHIAIALFVILACSSALDLAVYVWLF